MLGSGNPAETCAFGGRRGWHAHGLPTLGQWGGGTSDRWRQCCEARAALASDVGVWEPFGFPVGKLGNEYWCAHLPGRVKGAGDGVGEATRVLKWHHFLPSQGP